MKIIERLYQYLDYKMVKPTNFEKEAGLSNGYLSVQKKRLADMGEGVIVKIIENCRDLSIEWLMTGEGEMLRSGLDQQPAAPPEPTYIYRSDPKDTAMLELQRKHINLLEEQITDLKKDLGIAFAGSDDYAPVVKSHPVIAHKKTQKPL